MSGILETNEQTKIGQSKPDPTFLADGKYQAAKSMGLPLQERLTARADDLSGKRLTRKELESMFDRIYDEEAPTSTKRQIGPDHASQSGNRLVRNISLSASAALFFGFALGLYSLANQGAETSLGKQFNQFIAEVNPFEKSSATGVQGNDQPAAKANPFPDGKPIKTASLVVSDVAGTIKAGIPLKLSLSGNAISSAIEVKVMNVPADAVLTLGKRDKQGVWTLQPGDLKNVALVLSTARQGPLKLDVELLEAKTGQLLTPTRRVVVAITEIAPVTLSGFVRPD